MSSKAGVQLTQKESELLTAVIQEMDSVPVVDFEKIKDKVGHKYARNARAAFLKVWGKLKEGVDGEASAGHEDTEAAPKTPAKKKVGKTTTLKKAGEGGPKKSSAHKPKKEEQQQDGEVKQEAKEEFGEIDEDDGGKSQLPIPTMFRQDGFPEGTTNLNIREEATMIGLCEDDYRAAVKVAMQKHLQSKSLIPEMCGNTLLAES